jgi:hypothetical protein
MELKAAEFLFRHKVLRFLKEEELISDERTRLFSSWTNGGFSVHNNTTVYSNENAGLQALAFYMFRAPVSLKRLGYEPDTGNTLYREKI